MDQTLTWKIPSGIPSEVTTANKTGEKDNTQNDVAIVYTPLGDYILCIMATDLTEEDINVEHIRELSAAVYDYFMQAWNSEDGVPYDAADSEEALAADSAEETNASQETETVSSTESISETASENIPETVSEETTETDIETEE